MTFSVYHEVGRCDAVGGVCHEEITSGVPKSNFVRPAKASGLPKFYMSRRPDVFRIPRSGCDSVGGVCHEVAMSPVGVNMKWL